VNKAVDYVSDKTGTKVSIDRLFITFSGNVFLEGLYLEDLQQDTLVYSEALEVSVALLPLIRGEEINVKSVDWSGLRANIYRKDTSSLFNYEFLITAFAGSEETTTQTEPAPLPEISIGQVDFSNFDIRFRDDQSGMNSHAVLGKLNLEIDNLDLEKMAFAISELAIADTEIEYLQKVSAQSTAPTTAVDTGTESPMPTLSVANFRLDNVRLNYESIPDRMLATADIGELFLNLPGVDLEQQTITLEAFRLNNSDVFIKQRSGSPPTPADSTSSPIEFAWPDWQLTANTVAMTGNSFELNGSDTLPEKGVFDPDRLSLQNLSLQLADMVLQPNSASLKLKNLSMTERSGLTLKKLAFDFSISDTKASINQLQLATAGNSLDGNVELSHNTLNALINQPETAQLALDLQKLNMGLSEAFLFNPELAQNEYLSLLASKPLTGAIKVNGMLSEMDIPQANLKWGNNTAIDLRGKISNAMEPDKIMLDLPYLQARTGKSDLGKILSESDAGIIFPESMTLNGRFKGSQTRGATNLKLSTSVGSISLEGRFDLEKLQSLEAELTVADLLPGRLIQNQQLDTLSFTASITGSGQSLNALNLELTTDFRKLSFDGYDFSGLSLSGKLTEGSGNVDLAYKDRNLDMTLKTLVTLDSVAPAFNTTLNVTGADLSALGLTTENIRTAFIFNADFKGNPDEFELKSTLRDGIAVYKREAYNFGTLDLTALAKTDSVSVSVSSSVLDTKINANKGIAALIPVFQQQFERYLSAEVLPSDSIADPAKINMSMVVRQAPILTEVFLQGLNRLDSVFVNLDFDEQTSNLSAQLIAPFIDFQGSQMDSLEIKLSGVKDVFNFSAGWAALTSGPLAIDKTSLSGNIENNLISSNLTVYDDAERLVYLDSETSFSRDTIRYHIISDQLTFNKKAWKISPDNLLTYGPGYLDLKGFDFANGDQRVTLSTRLPDEQYEHIGATFENFQLATITNLLNADRPIARGVLGGDFVLENPFGNYGILAELGINNLSLLEVPFGVLNLKAQSDNGENYGVNLSLKGDNADLELTGGYRAAEGGPELTLDLLLRQLQVAAIEKFSNEAISESLGAISGEIKVSGTASEPVYDGSLNFEQVTVLVNQLNTRFTFNDEQLRINNTGLFLDNFVITDSQRNNFSLDGKILTTELTNPAFDLRLRANEFGLLNSSKEDSELFYGTVNMNADLRIQGDLNIPKVRGNLKINDVSDLTLTVPESQLELKARDGVVLFVNRKNPDDILTRVRQNESSAMAEALAGYDIETVVSVGEGARFTIIIDEATGDNLQVAGTGDFSLGLEPNGRMSLSGKYQLRSGHYETNLYNLVKRKFEIAPGSSITWSGDPYDAELDVSAIYNIKTSAAPLMAVRTSSQSDEISSTYQERLPFQVYINVAGVLLRPEISFNLEMPDSERGALGGDVYTQVQQLNNQEEELNKQVFSLLVLNRFFPGAGSDGSNGGPASLALDNVNKVLSGQLNNYSDKLFGKTGLELGFDLNSTNNAQSSTTQTQLGISARKRLFNDRLIVQVGSEVDVAGGQSSSEGAPIIGNVSVEYLLTQDKRLRLQGFSRNVYEGVIDGQLTVSGIALIFSREFNKFKELWTRQVKEEVEKMNKSDKDK
jgi:hypothetical protein